MHNLLFVPAGGSAALFHDGHLDKSCETYTNWTFFLSFFQVMDSDVVVLLDTSHKGLPPTWLRPGVAVINLGSALMEGIFLQSKAVTLGITLLVYVKHSRHFFACHLRIEGTILLVLHWM